MSGERRAYPKCMKGLPGFRVSALSKRVEFYPELVATDIAMTALVYGAVKAAQIREAQRRQEHWCRWKMWFRCWICGDY